MVLCISGNYRSGKSGLGTELSKKLEIPYYSMRLWKEQKNTEYNTDFVDWAPKIEFDDNQQIDERIVATARRGNCLLDFRYAAMLCAKNGIDYVGIWVSSDMESRIYGNSYCWQKTAQETEKIIREREKAERDVCAALHHADYSSPEYYHYFIDLSSYWYPIEEVSKRGFLFEELIDNLNKTIAEEKRDV